MSQPHFGIYNWEGGAFGVALASTSITAVGQDGCDAVRIEGQPPAWIVDGVAKLLAERVGVERTALAVGVMTNVEMTLHGFTAPDEGGKRRRVSALDLVDRDASEADVSQAWEGLSRQVEGVLEDLRDAPPQKRPQIDWWQRFSAVQRHSFIPVDGRVRRVDDRCGRWIDQYEAGKIVGGMLEEIRELRDAARAAS